MNGKDEVGRMKDEWRAGNVSGHLIFTAATANEWGEALASAREFIDEARATTIYLEDLRMVKGTRLYELYQALSPRAVLLVELGKKLGCAVHGVILSTTTQDEGRAA